MGVALTEDVQYVLKGISVHFGIVAAFAGLFTAGTAVEWINMSNAGILLEPVSRPGYGKVFRGIAALLCAGLAIVHLLVAERVCEPGHLGAAECLLCRLQRRSPQQYRDAAFADRPEGVWYHLKANYRQKPVTRHARGLSAYFAAPGAAAFAVCLTSGWWFGHFRAGGQWLFLVIFKVKLVITLYLLYYGFWSADYVAAVGSHTPLTVLPRPEEEVRIRKRERGSAMMEHVNVVRGRLRFVLRRTVNVIAVLPERRWSGAWCPRQKEYD